MTATATAQLHTVLVELAVDVEKEVKTFVNMFFIDL